MFRNVFVFSFFRDFVMEVFDSTLDVGRWKLGVDYWIFDNNKVTTFNQDLTEHETCIAGEMRQIRGGPTGRLGPKNQK